MYIRTERGDDKAAIRMVNEAAFETAAEANLVDALRERAKPIISLVAADGADVVGHLLLTPVELSGHGDLKLMGLAPMAVLPRRQRQGLGSELVRAGLAACQRLGFGAVVVLGHPEYYPRFGFSPASGFGIDSEYDVPDEVFMALELEAGYLDRAVGMVEYHAAFKEL